MDSNSCDKYSFLGEWMDPELSLTKQFIVHYYPIDSSITLFDVKCKRVFLKRSAVSNITLNDFYVGGSIRVFGRLIKIIDFASEETRKHLHKSIERIFALIKPTHDSKIGEIIQRIESKHFRITQMRKTVLSKETALQAFKSLRNDQNMNDTLDNITSGPVICMELVKENAMNSWFDDLGNSSSSLYGSKTAEEALRELSCFFPTGRLKSLGPPAIASYNNCTCCIIKPHALRDGNLGAILSAIAEHRYSISALKMVYMENVNAAEFYEVYKGVVPDYMGMVAELTSGPCVALEIVGEPDINTPMEFRKLVGPTDPDIAKQLRPHTLRARFGKTRLQNAIHCSDLPEDGLLEVEYFFKILDSQIGCILYMSRLSDQHIIDGDKENLEVTIKNWLQKPTQMQRWCHDVEKIRCRGGQEKKPIFSIGRMQFDYDRNNYYVCGISNCYHVDLVHQPNGESYPLKNARILCSIYNVDPELK